MPACPTPALRPLVTPWLLTAGRGSLAPLSGPVPLLERACTHLPTWRENRAALSQAVSPEGAAGRAGVGGSLLSGEEQTLRAHTPGPWRAAP